MLAEFFDDLELECKLLDSCIVVEEDDDKSLGSTEIFSNYGFTFLFAASGLLLIIVILIIAVVVCSRCCSDKNKERLQWLKQKIFFTPMIRFAMINCLKFNINALLVFKSFQDSDLKEKLVASFGFFAINVLPIVFSRFIWKNYDNL